MPSLKLAPTVVVAITGLLLIANFSFPPWKRTLQYQVLCQITYPLGYRFIADAPTYITDPPKSRRGISGVQLDAGRLVLQTASILVAGGVAFSIVNVSVRGSKRQASSNSAG